MAKCHRERQDEMERKVERESRQLSTTHFAKAGAEVGKMAPAGRGGVLRRQNEGRLVQEVGRLPPKYGYGAANLHMRCGAVAAGDNLEEAGKGGWRRL